MAAQLSHIPAKPIKLYTTQTPNGIKISIALEELGLPYEVFKHNFVQRTQKEPWYLEINPNGRIPAITDVLDHEEIHVWESGSILKYLVEQYDPEFKLWYPPKTKENYELFGWLFHQIGGLGPMQGQMTHFNRHAPEKIPYAINRYTNETRRLYKVLNTQLSSSKSGYVLSKFTIVDIVYWSMVAASGWAGVDVNEFPAVSEWYRRLLDRPSVAKGMNVPEIHPVQALMDDKTGEKAKEFENYSRSWVLLGMREDAEALRNGE
ncbi:hypothetical protein ACHAQJ_001374 [Trichoderma viride]